MVRSIVRGPLMIALTLAATAWGQSPVPQPMGGPTREPTLTVQEQNRPPQECRILRSWRTSEGAQAYEVQAIETGEMITIVESGALATPPAAGRPRARGIATRIYHWGNASHAPAGVPIPPDASASTMLQMPVAERLPPGDTHVTMPTPPLEVIVPNRNFLPQQASKSGRGGSTSMAASRFASDRTGTEVQPRSMPVAERLTSDDSHVGPAPTPAKTVSRTTEKSVDSVSGAEKLASPATHSITPSTVRDSGSLSPYGPVMSPARKSPVLQLEPSTVPPMPSGERRWPTAFSGQSPQSLPALASNQEVMPRATEDKGVAQHTGTPLANGCGPVTSTVIGPCDPYDPCAPPRVPLWKRLFKRPCDPCAKNPCCHDTCVTCYPEQAPVPAMPPAPTAQQPVAKEPSKSFPAEPIAKTPATQPESSDWRKSWGGEVKPRGTEQPIAATPLVPKTEIGTTRPSVSTPPSPLPETASVPPTVPPPAPVAVVPAEPKKVEKTARPLVEVASEPSKQPAEKKDDGWKPFWKREQKKPEATTRVEEKTYLTPPNPAVKETPSKEPPAKGTIRLPFWKKDPKSSEKKPAEVSKAPASSPTDWGATGKPVDTKNLGTPRQPTHLPEMTLPRARTSPDADPLTDYARKSAEKVEKTETKGKETEVKSKSKETEAKNKSGSLQVGSKLPESVSPANDNPPGSGSVIAAGAPQYVPVPIVTVPDLTRPTNPPPSAPPPAPQPNAGKYFIPNPLTPPPPGLKNAFTNPGVQNPIPSETLPAETSTNAFDPPGFEGKGTPPLPIQASMRNTPFPPIKPTPVFPPPQGVPPGACPPGPLTYPMQGLPPRPVQPMGPGAPSAQPMPGVAWVPQQQYVPANYFNIPAATHVNVYAAPHGGTMVSAQPQPDAQAQPALLMQMLRESDYPSQREWAAEQLLQAGGRSNPQAVNALVTAAKDDPAPMVRVQCVRSLAKMQVQTLAVSGLLQQLQADSDPRVRDAAGEAMTALGMTPPRKDAVVPVSAPGPMGGN